jgi:hypothetical protein
MLICQLPFFFFSDGTYICWPEIFLGFIQAHVKNNEYSQRCVTWQTDTIGNVTLASLLIFFHGGSYNINIRGTLQYTSYVCF